MAYSPWMYPSQIPNTKKQAVGQTTPEHERQAPKEAQHEKEAVAVICSCWKGTKYYHEEGGTHHLYGNPNLCWRANLRTSGNVG